MGEVLVGFVLTGVSFVVFMSLSYWQLRRVHGSEAAADGEAREEDDSAGSA